MSASSPVFDHRPELLMYFREGCHLCEDMQQQLIELLEPEEYRLTLIDIDEDEQLREAYNARVPVLCLVPRALPLHSLELATAKETGGEAKNALESGKLSENMSPMELCEHFLDLLAVREALASYNR